jgi:phage/plasmid-associated DNA primase
MTGGDSFFARGCGEDGGSIAANFKSIMVLNIVPDISGLDEATMKRLGMILFEGRWYKTNEARALGIDPNDIEGQIKRKEYIMDDRIDDDIPRLASALLWLAVKNYPKYRKEGLENPPYIRRWMEEYWKKHDPINAFLSEKMENPKKKCKCSECDYMEDKSGCVKCEGKEFYEEIDVSKSVTATEIYPEFKRWMKETYPESKLTPKNRMTDMLSSKDKLGPLKGRKWYGFQLKRPEVTALEE